LPGVYPRHKRILICFYCIEGDVMKISSQSFEHEKAIGPANAFAKPDAQAHMILSDNKNPHLAWTDAPEGTRSFVVLCVDKDVPSKPDDVNQDDREVPASLPRVDFYHWALVDIPANITEIAEGEFSNGVTPKGKSGPLAAKDMRQGINDFTNWFAGDHDMKGDYFGYDGPCPPFNDALVHRYYFTVYALDIDSLPLTGSFTCADVAEAIAPHVLDQATIMGLYSLNPKVSF